MHHLSCCFFQVPFPSFFTSIFFFRFLPRIFLSRNSVVYDALLRRSAINSLLSTLLLLLFGRSIHFCVFAVLGSFRFFRFPFFLSQSFPCNYYSKLLLSRPTPPLPPKLRILVQLPRLPLPQPPPPQPPRPQLQLLLRPTRKHLPQLPPQLLLPPRQPQKHPQPTQEQLRPPPPSAPW